MSRGMHGALSEAPEETAWRVPGRVEVLANYTAFRDLKKAIERRAAASESERFPLAELEAAITAVEHAEYRYAQAALQT